MTISKTSKNLIELIKSSNQKPADIAEILDVNISQIYYWNRNGIKKSNPHYTKLKELFPELQAKETNSRKNGKEDKRSYNRRPRKNSITINIEETEYEEQQFIASDHPRLPGCKDEYGLPYVNVDKRDDEWYEKRKDLPKIDPLKIKGIKWDRLPE